MILASTRFWIELRWRYLLVCIAVSIILVTAFVYRKEMLQFFQKSNSPKGVEVSVPTIIDGELVLPKVATGSGGLSGENKKPAIGVVSANLVGVFDQEHRDASGSPKLAGIRIIGEMVNLSANRILGLSPLVKFIDGGGKMVSQKVGRLTSGFDFMNFGPEEKAFYDVTVDDPPAADRLEVALNPAEGVEKILREKLKVASFSAETKLADLPSEASGSAAKKAEYYLISGVVENSLSDDVTGIVVYAWARDKEGKIFGFSRQDFTSDLLPKGEKIDFKILLLPVRLGSKLASFEVGAWGKRYKLSL